MDSRRCQDRTLLIFTWGSAAGSLGPPTLSKKMGFEATPASKSQDSVGFGEARTIRQAKIGL